jgi:hypothetical protein
MQTASLTAKCREMGEVLHLKPLCPEKGHILSCTARIKSRRRLVTATGSTVATSHSFLLHHTLVCE